MNQKKYLITPSLLNSWKYAISLENDYGNLEDFKKVLSREPQETTEVQQIGYDYEAFMIENYEKTKDGCYQVKLSKNITTNTGNYVLYGRLDCLKAGVIYDYKYTSNYDVGKYFGSYQTLIYFELCPEATEFVYLICNNYKKGKSLEELNLYRENYMRDSLEEIKISQEIDNFISWLKANNLYDYYCENWESKF